MLAILVALTVAVPHARPAHDRAFWIAIAQNNYEVPSGQGAFALLVEMNDLIGSTDPVLRDEVAYGAAARWILQKRLLTADQQRTILRLWTANLSAGLGDEAGDTVFRRSFSALNLSLLAALDNQRPFLSESEYDALLAQSLDYLARERDTRGYDTAKGWMHTPAHTADLLKFLARNPKLPRSAQERLLRAISDKCGAVAHGFVWGEDERFAQVVRSIVRRPDFDPAVFDAWLAAAGVAHRRLWAHAPAIDPSAFPGVYNLKAVLRASFVALSADSDLSPESSQARTRVLQTLVKR